jgi:hypothetical protein
VTAAAVAATTTMTTATATATMTATNGQRGLAPPESNHTSKQHRR